MELVYTALFIPLIPGIISIVKWRNMNSPQKWFGSLMWFIIFVSFSGRVWSLVTEENNLPFYYVYILGEYLLLLQIFRLLFDGYIHNKTWFILALSFSVSWLINVTTGQGWWVFPDYIRALEAIIILTIVVIWFLKMLKEKTILQPFKTFEFWICAGLLIFFSGNFLLFVFPKIILNAGKEVFHAIWKVNATLNILLYLLYSVALLWVRRIVK